MTASVFKEEGSSGSVSFFESHSNGKHDCLLTSSFHDLSRQIWTDTTLTVNGWSDWPGGRPGVVFLTICSCILHQKIDLGLWL